MPRPYIHLSEERITNIKRYAPNFQPELMQSHVVPFLATAGGFRWAEVEEMFKDDRMIAFVTNYIILTQNFLVGQQKINEMSSIMNYFGLPKTLN